MKLQNIKRIVDCLSPRDACGLWGLKAVAGELGMADVANEADEFACKLFEISSKMVELARERDALIDQAAKIRPQVLLEIERLREIKDGIKRMVEGSC